MPGEFLSVRHRGERLAYYETVEFVCSGGEPGALGRGERDRHRVVVFGVVGEEMISNTAPATAHASGLPP